MRKIKKYLKTGILLIGISLLLWNCEKEDSEIIQSESDSDFKIEIVTLKQIESNAIASNKLNKIITKTSNTLSNYASKDIYNAQYNFTVNTDYVKYIEKGEYHSYNFPITRENPVNDNIENLLLSLNTEGGYDAYLVEYVVLKESFSNLSIEELNSITTHFTPINIDSSSLLAARLSFECVVDRFLYCPLGGGHTEGFGDKCELEIAVVSTCSWVNSGGSSDGTATGSETTNEGTNETSGGTGGTSSTNNTTIDDNPIISTPTVDIYDGFSIAKYLNTIKDETSWTPVIGTYLNRPTLKYTHKKSYYNGDTQYLLQTGEQLLVSNSKRPLNDSSSTIIGTSEDNGPYHYLYTDTTDKWYEMSLDNSKTNCLSCDLEYLVGEVLTTGLKLTGRYVIPIEDALIIIDGKDFDSNAANKYIAGGMLIFAIVPGGKIVKPLAKTIKSSTTALQIVIREGGEFAIESIGKAVNVEIKAVPIDDFIKYVSETGEEMARIANDVFTISKHKIKSKAGSVIFRNADDVNVIMKSKGYNDPPIKHEVTEFISKETEQFIRFHNSSNPNRSWMMKLSDVENLSNLDQVRNAFSLNSDNLIDKVSFFNVPAGKKMYAGNANNLYGFDGNGFQFFIDENVEISWRTKEMDLIDFFK